MLSKYDETSVKVLSSIEAIRKKAGMYVGDTENFGLWVILKEAIDNALDEAGAGFGKQVEVWVSTKNGVTQCAVRDYGRGIPIGKHPKTGKPTVTTVLTLTHAGAKFDDSTYKTATGCFTGDTEIRLLRGGTVRVKDLHKKFLRGKIREEWAYSFDPEGETAFVPGRIYHTQLSKYVDELAVVTLDSGEKIRCTVDHPFLSFDGEYIQAKDLKPGQSLRAVHFGHDKDGYETHTTRYGSSRMQARYIGSRPKDARGCYRLRTNRTIMADSHVIEGMDVHHINGVVTDNRPHNLEALSHKEHFWTEHLERGSHKHFINSPKKSQWSRKKMQSLNTRKGLQKKAYLGRIIQVCARTLRDHGSLTPELYDSTRSWGAPGSRKVEWYYSWAFLKKEARKYLKKYGENGKRHNGGNGLDYQLLSEHDRKMEENFNHKVVGVKIRRLRTPEAVYGISVDPHHNYLLGAGVFVKNTHGVGITATNALSSRLIVACAKDRKWHSQSFEKGEEVSKLQVTRAKSVVKLASIGEIDDRKVQGTFISFTADKSIFKSAELQKDTVTEYLRLMACAHKKVSIVLRWNGKEKTYAAPDGFLAWVRRERKRLETNPLVDIPPFIHEGNGVACALGWVESTEAEMVSSVSGAKTSRGGTHVRGFLEALQEALSLKKKEQVSPDNLLVGVCGVLNINMSAPSFSGQTKEVLASPGAKSTVAETLRDPLRKYFRKHKALRAAIVERAMALRKADDDHKAARKLISSLKTNKSGKTLLPAKLSACPSCKPMTREVYVVEGDSAGGTLKTARNSKFQEVLPLRGKIMNVARNSNPTESAEVLAILQTIGFSAKEKQEYRVGKVVIATDSDQDGAHISALTLTVLAKFCPDVFKKGMIYLSDVPLYSYRDGKTFIHAPTLDELRKKVGSKFDKKKLTRAKGLGELNADEARFSLMNPDTRMLLKVDPFGSEKDKKLFWRLVGDDVQLRRDLLGI